MTAADRVLRWHLAIAAAGAATLALTVVAIASAISFRMPVDAVRDSHWGLVRAALTPSSVITLALVCLAVAAIVAGAASLWRQHRRAQAFIASFAHLGVSGEVTLVKDERPVAFCAGLRSPRVFVSTGRSSCSSPAP